MDNELTPQTSMPEPAPENTTSGPRDIIAERMAARLAQQRERTSAPQEPADTNEEPMLPFTEEPNEPKRDEPVVAALRLNPELASATDAMQAAAPEAPAEPTPDKPAELPLERAPRLDERRDRRDRGDRRDRNRGERREGDRREGDRRERPPRPDRETRESREPRELREPREQREARPPRTEQRSEQRAEQRSERPAREQRPERPARPDLRNVPKTSENAFARARALASREGVSIVIPLYNEQESLRELTAAVRDELYKLCDKNYEVIFINDGSTDRSGDILRDISEGSSRVTVLTFRSNLGKSAALAAGFKEAKFGIVITMDADLQDDPKEFVHLIAKLDEGYDLVTGWKKKRNDPLSKTAPSKLFNSVTSFFAGLKLHDFNCGLKAYRKAVTDSLDVYGEMHRYLPALAHWQGFRVTEIPVLHHPRKFGKSKFGTSRFFKGFLDLLTIIFTSRYGRRPLHFFGTIGTSLSLIGLGINIYVSIEWARGLTTLSNRPILLLGVLLILVGVQLISIGLLGEMMVKNSMRSSESSIIRSKRSPRPNRERIKN